MDCASVKTVRFVLLAMSQCPKKYERIDCQRLYYVAILIHGIYASRQGWLL